MGLLVAYGYLKVWHLFAFTVITGVTWAFVDPVRQSLVPALVPREDLANAVALNSAAFNLTKVIGLSLGGALIVFSGAAGNFFVQSAAYVGVLISVYWMTIPPTPPEARAPRPRQSQRGTRLCLVQPGGVRADDERAGAEDLRGAPDSDAGVSERRAQGGAGGTGNPFGSAGTGCHVGGLDACDAGQSRPPPRRLDARQPGRARDHVEPFLLDEIVSPGAFVLGRHWRLSSGLHGERPTRCSR